MKTLAAKRYLRKHHNKTIVNLMQRKAAYTRLQESCEEYHKWNGPGVIIGSRTFHLLAAINILLNGLPFMINDLNKEILKRKRIIKRLK